MSEHDGDKEGRMSDSEFEKAVEGIRQTVERYDGVDVGMLAQEGARRWQGEHDAALAIVEAEQRLSRKLVRNWFGRWMRWLYLVAKDLPEMAEGAAMMGCLWCTFGSVALVSPPLAFLAVEAYGLPLILASLAGFGVYLAVGLIAFFHSPLTNIPIHWTKNGGW